jgi:polyvinyl alcohol dehydrogenase (cytochrome)
MKNSSRSLCTVFAGVAMLMACDTTPAVAPPDVLAARLAEKHGGRAATWPIAGHDPEGTHHNKAERRIDSSNVGQLVVKWTYDGTNYGRPLGALHGTPVVSKDAIFVGSNSGRFFALNLDGTLRWEYVTLPPNPLLAAIGTPSPVGGVIPDVAGTPIVGGAVYAEKQDVVVFGDLDGNIYALDGQTGAEVWVKPQVDAHPLGGIVGNSLVLAKDKVVIGFAAIEDSALLINQSIPYKCCSHTGFVASLDIATGAEGWRYETVKAAEVQPLVNLPPFELGPSGADIWAQPTFDKETDTIYVGTGQNYSPGPDGKGTSGSDSFFALDANTGAVKWTRQVTSNDVWVRGIPSPDANGRWVDQDIGDAPKVYRLRNGRKVIAAGQKSGAFWVLDARTGEVVNSQQAVQQANQLGGLQNGGAQGRGKVYVHGLNGTDPTTDTAPFIGTVKAYSENGARELWSFDVPLGIFVAPLALAKDVLYFVSPISELPVDGGVTAPLFSLVALNADTGAPLAQFPFPGRAISGPVISEGRIYVVSGNRAVAELGESDEGAVRALGLPD